LRDNFNGQQRNSFPPKTASGLFLVWGNFPDLCKVRPCTNCALILFVAISCYNIFMLYFILPVFFLFGLVVGSFLNSVIFWQEGGRKSLRGRSFCPSCRHKLGLLDLVPVLSWVFLRGRCRYCRAQISWQYPLTEIGTGILFVLTYLFVAVNYPAFSLLHLLLATCYLLLINSLLLVIFVFDLKHYLIPNKIAILAVIIAGGHFLLSNGYNYLFSASFSAATVLFSLVSIFITTGLFYTLVTLSGERWMGKGDIILVFLVGIFLEYPKIWAALFLAFILASIVGIFLIILKRKTLKSQIPFGPFVIFGTWIALFWGNEIINWYLSLL